MAGASPLTITARAPQVHGAPNNTRAKRGVTPNGPSPEPLSSAALVLRMHVTSTDNPSIPAPPRTPQ